MFAAKFSKTVILQKKRRVKKRKEFFTPYVYKKNTEHSLSRKESIENEFERLK